MYGRDFFLGTTVQGLKIPAIHFGRLEQKAGGKKIPKVLILGGVHGDESEGVYGAHGLLQIFRENFPFQLNLTLVPTLNLDGVIRQQRVNARGVDLNRNLPTKDWKSEVAKPRYNPGPFALSEPENIALVDFLKKETPDFLLSLHAWNPMLNINGKCRELAEVIAARTGYIITDDIGYPTPGSLGTYAGQENGIPTLTYEIESGLDCPSILKTHVPAIIEGLKWIEMEWAKQ